MSYKNSYFSLIITDMGVSMKYYPPLEGGRPLKMEDVTKYLEKHKITNYDTKAINDVINQSKPMSLRISDESTYQINEYMDIMTTPDNMLAVARFYPPSDKGCHLSYEEIMNEFQMRKITFGIQEDIIRKYIANPVYMVEIPVARGIKPVHGTDAKIEYKFNTNRKAKPQLNEDGTVDFHKLNNISHISSGDVLAVLHPEDPGSVGTSIYGATVNPRKVAKAVFRYGNNIELSEDGLKLIAKVDGHASLDGDRVSVSNVYDVPNDVDNSTGDIEYNGDIAIKGNVRAGFKVQAKGNVEVFGVVEGAIVIAGGDIIIHRGIQGMGKSQIVAGHNLVAKFIESANVAVNGYIETDTILHSNVSAKGDIFVRGKNGNIMGGTVRSTTLIEASNIGSAMGTVTNVEVGCDPSVIDKVNSLKKQIMELNKEKTEYTQNILIFKKKLENGRLDKLQLGKMQEMAKKTLEIDQELAKLSDEYEIGMAKLSEDVDAKINVNRTIYQGCKVSISGDYILVHESLSRCRYKKEHGEIKAVPL